MGPSEFIAQHLDVGLRIHACCDDLGLDRRTARLMTYIHLRAVPSAEGEMCLAPRAAELAALGVLLGRQRLGEACDAASPSGIEAVADQALQCLSDRVATLVRPDGTPVSDELQDRLRLSEDGAFREEMLALYRERIRPTLQ